MQGIKSLCGTLRVKQYIQNLPVFFPLVWGGRLFQTGPLLKTLAGFVALCCVSSLIALLGERGAGDEPVKEEAGKALLPRGAAGIAIALVGVMTLCDYIACRSSFTASMLMLLYLILRACYSLGLREVKLLDIALLAFGVVLQVFFGAAVTGMTVTASLFFAVLAVGFYMGLWQRRSETGVAQVRARRASAVYPAEFFTQSLTLCAGAGLVFYALWCADPATVAMVGSTRLAWTVPVALAIWMKMNLYTEKHFRKDGPDLILGDWALAGLLGGHVLLTVLLIYLL